MKKLKSLIVLLIVMSLMFTTVACGNKEQGQDATSDKTDQTQEEQTDKDEKEDQSGESRKLHLLGPDRGGDIKFADREKYPVWEELQKLNLIIL